MVVSRLPFLDIGLQPKVIPQGNHIDAVCDLALLSLQVLEYFVLDFWQLDYNKALEFSSVLLDLTEFTSLFRLSNEVLLCFTLSHLGTGYQPRASSISVCTEHPTLTYMCRNGFCCMKFGEEWRLDSSIKSASSRLLLDLLHLLSGSFLEGCVILKKAVTAMFAVTAVLCSIRLTGLPGFVPCLWVTGPYPPTPSFWLHVPMPKNVLTQSCLLTSRSLCLSLLTLFLLGGGIRLCLYL